jgi:dipeptidase
MSVHPHFQQYFNYSMVFSIQFSCWRILEYLDNPQYPEKTINLPTIHSTQRKSSICRQSTVPRENHQSADNPQYPEKTINLPTIHSTQRKPSSIIETKVLLPQE